MAPARIRLYRALAAARAGPLPNAARLVVLAAVLGVAAPEVRAQSAAYFEYLYVEANAGGSSGGHTAVRFGDACYHFQHDENGTIRARKDSCESFEHSYRAVGNRAVHASRIRASADTYNRLHDAFDTRYLVQTSQLEALDSLAQDRDLLEFLLRRRRLSAASDLPFPIRFPGTAYFTADAPSPAESPGSTAARHARSSHGLAALAERVRRSYGEGVLTSRAASLRAAIARLAPDTAVSDGPLPQAGRLASSTIGFAERYRELVTGLAAAEVLQGGLALRDAVLWAPVSDDFALDPGEAEALRAHASRLQDALVRLVGSDRPDSGYPLLVGMARLLALERSIETGHLTFLDVFAEDARHLPAEMVADHAPALSLLLGERREDFLRSRADLFARTNPGETYLSRLETTANLFLEMQRALARRSAMRIHDDLVPAKGAGRDDWPLPQLSEAHLAPAVEAARARERRYASALTRLYPYDVVRRNCVTEVFRTIAAALEPTGMPALDRGEAIAEERLRLGGHVSMDGSLNFIPFLSAEAVRSAYQVAQSTERQSLRQIALADMYARENPLLVSLRESNVLTSRVYQPNQDDSVFLLFTDDMILPRPIYGAANLAAGLAAAMAGVAVLPFDRGTTLRRGFEGIVFSVPELAFVNIRKGTFPFAPRRWLRGEGMHGYGSREGNVREADRPSHSGD